MAIDFPNSPTVGQIFTVGNRSWQWDGATWNIYANVPNRYIQDAAPSSPQSGDQWFESDTGRLFVYYDSAWVEIGNATDIAGALQPGQITALSAVTSLTTDDVFPVVDNPSSATATNKITYGNLVTALSSSLAPGLVLVKTQSIGSAVSSVTVSDAFSSSYDNYRIVINVNAFSASPYMRIQLGSTTTGYYWGAAVVQYSSGTVSGIRSNNDASWNGLGPGTTAGGSGIYDLLNPYATEPTLITGSYSDFNTAGSAGSGSGFLDNTTSYTAFTLSTSTGTMTGGTIRVYGYRNS